MDITDIKRKDLLSLIMTGVIDRTFEIQTKEKMLKVRMVLLTESEDIECQKISGQYDLITREKIYRTEVLSRAIMDIDGQGFGDEDKRIEILKNVLDKIQTPMIVQLWEFYLDLRQEQQLELGELQQRQLKNSSGNPKS